jgi:hypothetical protein
LVSYNSFIKLVKRRILDSQPILGCHVQGDSVTTGN